MGLSKRRRDYVCSLDRILNATFVQTILQFILVFLPHPRGVGPNAGALPLFATLIKHCMYYQEDRRTPIFALLVTLLQDRNMKQEQQTNN